MASRSFAGSRVNVSTEGGMSLGSTSMYLNSFSQAAWKQLEMTRFGRTSAGSTVDSLRPAYHVRQRNLNASPASRHASVEPTVPAPGKTP